MQARKAIEVKRQKIADYSISRRKSDLTADSRFAFGQIPGIIHLFKDLTRRCQELSADVGQFHPLRRPCEKDNAKVGFKFFDGGCHR